MEGNKKKGDQNVEEDKNSVCKNKKNTGLQEKREHCKKSQALQQMTWHQEKETARDRKSEKRRIANCIKKKSNNTSRT